MNDTAKVFSRNEVREMLHQAAIDCARRSQVLRIEQGHAILPVIAVHQTDDGMIIHVGNVKQVNGV